MALQVKPGQWVEVKVTSVPRTAAGKKTMTRLFEQDPEIKKERARHARSRLTIQARRGGRLWNNIPSRLSTVSTERGQSYRVFASVSALRDLASVEKYIEVKPAK